MDASTLVNALDQGGGRSSSPVAAGLQAFAAALRPRSEHPAEASTSFWHEMHVELRRQAGNGRLPPGLRGALRQFAQRAAARDARQSTAALQRFPRRLLRDSTPARLSDERQAGARESVARAGIEPGAPIALVEVRNRPDVLLGACDLLRARGLTVVTMGHALPASLRRPGIVELGANVEPLVELALVSRSHLTLCGGWDLQYASALFDRPSVTLNGTEPFRSYPVKANGVYLLRTALESVTGRELSLDEQLTESYFRNLRHHVYREHTAADVTSAVAEVLDGIDGARDETEAQANVRALLTDAGERLAVSARHVATWGPDRGFLGDGRLARVQAGRLS